MNYRPAAFKAAIIAALMLVPGALFASGNGDCTCVDFDQATEVVTGVTANWSMEHLRHRNTTQHQFIGDPGILPPGPCRVIAFKWNIGVFLNRGEKFFSRMLRKSAQHNCRIEFDKAANANQDGSFDLNSVKPSK